MATVGRATSVWDRCENTFYFQMPPGITKAYMEFSGIPGHYQFDFYMFQCTGSFVSWGDSDYDYESDRFQLERGFSSAILDQLLQITHLGDYTAA